MSSQIDYSELEIALATLRSNLVILENAVANLKDKDVELVNSLNKASDDIVEMRLNVNDRFHNVSSEVLGMDSTIHRLKQDIIIISQSISTMEDKVDGLTDNSLLKFTSDLDLKKTLSLTLLIISIISSPGIFASWLNGEGQSNSNKKLDTLIDLIQDDS